MCSVDDQGYERLTSAKDTTLELAKDLATPGLVAASSRCFLRRYGAETCR